MEERLSVLSPAPTAAVPTTVASGITGGSSVPAPVLPVSAVASLGSALPVPPRIRDRITRGEFIVFDELLTESLAAPPELHLALAGDGLVKIDRATTELKRKVCNLQTWLEAWTVYYSILCDAAPERVQDLLFYQGTIVEASSKYSSDAWLTYDRRFRMALAAQPHAFSWRTIDPNLWQSCMTAKALPPCFRCHTTHPLPGPACPFRTGPPPAPSSASGGQQRQTIFLHNGKPMCRNFNWGNCSDATLCRRAHICFTCRPSSTLGARSEISSRCAVWSALRCTQVTLYESVLR